MKSRFLQAIRFEKKQKQFYFAARTSEEIRLKTSLTNEIIEVSNDEHSSGMNLVEIRHANTLRR